MNFRDQIKAVDGVIDTLPEGDWKCAYVEYSEEVVFACPQHPPRFYRDGKLVRIGPDNVAVTP